MMLILLPVAFLLPPRTGAGEIVGGHEAKPHSRPYMAFLRIQEGHNYKRCGGFLVTENFVLTAAHCRGDRISVTLGAHNIDKREPSQQVIPVSRQIPHPRYNKNTFNNDIMLLQLAKSAELNDVVDTIPLPEEDDTVELGSVCSVAGWGRTSPKKNTSLLHEVELKVMSDGTCQEYVQIRHFYRPGMMMCVGNPAEKKAILQGDSGGPLVCDGKAQGIVSYGSANGSTPSVFTKLSKYLCWIQKSQRLH
uniref:Peptidase S1 domain-containing protein n=1 Tax=Pelodiscus sinensis TaxID=13735 RepID=K7F7Z3_PELSI